MSSELNELDRGGTTRPTGISGRSVQLEELSDAALLAAHVQGTPQAFAVLFCRHQDYLWQLAIRTSYTRDDAEDSLQDALLAAHRTAPVYRAEASVRSWLHSIVVNACLDRIRRNRARWARMYSTDVLPEPTELRNEFAELELHQVISKALLTLPPKQRAALVAVEMEGNSVAEAAELLGVAEGTIKSRCARARERLQERLEFFRDPRNRT